MPDAQIIPFPRRFEGTRSKKEIARILRRSPRYVEIAMKQRGLPFSRNELGHARFDVEAVLAWRDGEEEAANG